MGLPVTFLEGTERPGRRGGQARESPSIAAQVSNPVLKLSIPPSRFPLKMCSHLLNKLVMINEATKRVAIQDTGP